MKIVTVFSVVSLIVLLNTSSAQAATYMKLGDVKGESMGATSTGGLQVTTQIAATTSPEAKGKVDIQFKVEEGEKAGPALLEIDTIRGESPDAKPQGAGEKGGTEDINIGVGELQEGAQVVQHNQTDLDFLKGNTVSASAVTVRGWDPKQKQEFLATVKAHAEVQSGQDLENFAKGVLLKDENIEELSLNYEKIVINYRSSGKLFGFIPLSFTQEVELDTAGENVGRVKVKMPWFSFLMRADVGGDDVEEEASKQKDHDKWINIESWSFGERAEALSTLSNILKTKHDTVKNSIGNIR